jgi:hypothetical protein
MQNNVNMQVQELTTKDYISHLSRHPIPEIMDDACISALSSVIAQYGDEITHGAGLEVRLGEDARYVDYIMNIDEASIPGVKNLWYEIDYEEFLKVYLKGGRIAPCLFANTNFDPDDTTALDQFLPPFLGEARAKNLRAPLDHVLEKLPKGAYIKQIGTMTSRGELSIMRLVIMFPSWDTIPDGLVDIGWQGDAAMLKTALEPWKETKNIAVNIDLGENGVLPKIGVEVFSRWRHPILVDKFITRLEEVGLCLPSKGEALRRWIRIPPDGDPFIQTLISYFKLNYRDGKISEAKAYLEQSPYIHHHYFDAYEHPVRLDIELTDKESALSIDEALTQIKECTENRVRQVRLYGSEKYEHLDRLLTALKDSDISAEIVLKTEVDKGQLSQMIGLGNTTFLVDIGSVSLEAADLKTLSLLQEMKITPVRVRWHMNAENAGDIKALAEHIEALGVTELVVTGMCADRPEQAVPGIEDIKQAADFINEHESESEGESESGMVITVDSCFSPLRAYLGGEDPKQNANRGIARGCEAGRSFMALRADGKYSPCLNLETPGETSSLEMYWDQSDVIGSLRSEKRPSCNGCTYERRCLPCPVMREQGMLCPLSV